MAGRDKYEKRLYYTHMTEVEVELWNRFVEKFPGRFETVDYDFRVGKGIPFVAADEEAYIRMGKMLSQKRIDALGWVDEQPTIIEVKRRVGLSTVGQVLGYASLFAKEFKHFPVPYLMVVCEMISEDDASVLLDYEVDIEVV